MLIYNSLVFHFYPYFLSYLDNREAKNEKNIQAKVIFTVS